MKLVEIKDIRVGQIWRNSHWDLALIKKTNGENIEIHQWNYDTSSEQDYNTTLEYITKNSCNWKLIGFLGITHEIKDNKLVEIPNVFKNAKIHSDDIVIIHGEDDTPFLVDSIYNPNKYDAYISLLSYHDGDFTEDEVEKIGVLSVTHEFVNERLVK